MHTSVVIPVYHRDIKDLLASIPRGYEVIIVDNDAMSLAEKRNYGVLWSTGKYIYFVDDDNVLKPRAIEELEFELDKCCNVGIAASQAYSKDSDLVDMGAKRFLFPGFSIPMGHPLKMYVVDEVANAFMVRREVFHKIGLFDSQRFPMDMDEADLCLRARKAGWLVTYNSYSQVIHERVPTVPSFRRKTSAYYMGRNRILFQCKHLGKLYWLYLVTFFLVFIMVYVVSLAWKQPQFIMAFLKGVLDGLRNRT